MELNESPFYFDFIYEKYTKRKGTHKNLLYKGICKSFEKGEQPQKKGSILMNRFHIDSIVTFGCPKNPLEFSNS